MAKGWENLRKKAQKMKDNNYQIATPVTAEEQEVYEKALQKVKNMKSSDDYELVFDSEFELDFQKIIEQKIDEGKIFNIRLERSDFSDRTQSPFAPPNKYNSRIVLSHPAIRPHYERYQQHIKNSTPTDHQRWLFEEQVFEELYRIRISEDDFDIPQKKNNHNKNYNSFEK